MSTASAPVEIGRVVLTVNDLSRVAAFYQSALGLNRLSGDGASVLLGAGSRVLVELRGDPAARRAAPREAGLFHTAFLMPSRAALARWLIHAAESGIRLEGASDHHVSEAIYLADPEGNGIEVYADRPRDTWYGPDGKLILTTEGIDLNALARAADKPWTGIPDAAVVGHVHLQVGAVPEAEAFYEGTLGLPVMSHYPGAAFYGSGGYHHHIATNVWNSRGAGPRAFPATGLAAVELLAAPADHAAILARSGGTPPTDPWGTSILLQKKAP
jgi:catechol 2,3-dioxygenase